MPKSLARKSTKELEQVVRSRMQTVIASKREQNVLSEIAKETGLGIATVKVKDGEYVVLPRFQSNCCNASIEAKFKLVKLPPEPTVNGTKPEPKFGYVFSKHACMNCGKKCRPI